MTERRIYGKPPSFKTNTRKVVFRNRRKIKWVYIRVSLPYWIKSKLKKGWKWIRTCVCVCEYVARVHLCVSMCLACPFVCIFLPLSRFSLSWYIYVSWHMRICGRVPAPTHKWYTHVRPPLISDYHAICLQIVPCTCIYRYIYIYVYIYMCIYVHIYVFMFI